MIISDLNYMEDAAQEVAGAVGIGVSSSGFASLGADIRFNEVINKRFNINTSGVGFGSSVAEVTGTSDATGAGTFTNILFFTQTDPGRSESGVTATSVSTFPVY